MNDLSNVFSALERTANLLSATAARVDMIMNQQEIHEHRISTLEKRQDLYEDNVRIDRQQARQIKSHVMSKTAGLLGIKYEGKRVADESIETDKKYRSGFIARLYVEAKSSGLMGDPYSETKKKDFDDVINFIDSWSPNVDGGTSGYKEYLDKRREEKALKDSIKRKRKP